MSQSDLRTNPFALMMTPEAVFAAIENSERLARLKSRVCRPLDNPRPETPAAEAPLEGATAEPVGELRDWPDTGND